MQWILSWAGSEIAVGVGEVVLGRHPNCDVVLDGDAVSRRHAKLVATETEASIEDLGSANGVFVNGRRVEGKRPLASGDQIVVASHALFFHSAADTTLTRGHSSDPNESRVTLPGDEPSQSTKHTNALTLLASVAAKMLAMGKSADAERVLKRNLQNTLERATDGDLDAETMLTAARSAVDLADATKKAEWVNYIIALYASVREPMDADIVDRLYEVVRKVPPIDLQALRAYLQILAATTGRLTASARFTVQRIEGLEKLAAAR